MGGFAHSPCRWAIGAPYIGDLIEWMKWYEIEVSSDNATEWADVGKYAEIAFQLSH